MFILFGSCLALDERRIDVRKSFNCPCIAPKPDGWQPSKCNNIRIGQMIFGEMIPNLIFNTRSKVNNCTAMVYHPWH